VEFVSGLLSEANEKLNSRYELKGLGYDFERLSRRVSSLYGMSEEILDVHACDKWKKEHYFQYHNGHNCGICSSVCPYELKILKRNKSYL
jgi:ferredoxin